MSQPTKEQYNFALQRIEELLPLVDDNTPSNDRNAVELTLALYSRHEEGECQQGRGLVFRAV